MNEFYRCLIVQRWFVRERLQYGNDQIIRRRNYTSIHHQKSLFTLLEIPLHSPTAYLLASCREHSLAFHQSTLLLFCLVPIVVLERVVHFQLPAAIHPTHKHVKASICENRQLCCHHHSSYHYRCAAKKQTLSRIFFFHVTHAFNIQWHWPSILITPLACWKLEILKVNSSPSRTERVSVCLSSKNKNKTFQLIFMVR